MKQLTKTLAICAFSVSALVSCEKKDLPPKDEKPQGPQSTTLTASTAFTPEGKAFQWTNTDAIYVADGLKGYEFSAKSVDGKAATFEGTVDDPAKLASAFYPASKVVSLTDKVLHVNSIGIQAPETSSIYMFGLVKDAKVEFKPLFAYLKVDLDTEAAYIEITGGENEFIAGDLLVNIENGAVSIEKGSAAITLKEAKDGQNLKAGSYHIAMLPVALNSGIRLKVYGTNGKTKEFSLEKFSPKAGETVEFGHVSQLVAARKWTWGLDWESRKENFDPEKFVINEDNGFGTIQFVHTHQMEDYVVGITSEDLIKTVTFCFPEDHAKSYGFYGARTGDYWKIRCENIDLSQGSKIKVRLLVKGDNQSLVFWDGAYICDDSEPVLLPAADQTYAWTKTGKTSPTWSIPGHSRYVLGYDISKPSAASPAEHLIEETITLTKDAKSSFEFRIIAVDDKTFSKGTIAFDSATMRSDPVHSLAIIANEEIKAVTVEVAE